MNTTQPHAGPSTPAQGTAAAKWHKVHGPPIGSTFGARILAEDDDPFSNNAWDHAELPPDFEQRAAEIMAKHQSAPVAPELREEYNKRPAEYWNRFYSMNKAAFFKDRAWLRLEFPELIACSEADAGPRIVLEVGCGAGNTIFPLLMHNENPDLAVYSTDYSAQAIDVVKANPMYPRPPHGKGLLKASVWDITATSISTSPPTQQNQDPKEVATDLIVPAVAEKRAARRAARQSRPDDGFPVASFDMDPTTSSKSSVPVPVPDASDSQTSEKPPESQHVHSRSLAQSALSNPEPPSTFSLPEGLEPGTVDVITCIYVLSALHPREWRQAIHNLYTALKPGGHLLIRDYGRHDLAQLRIKADRLLDPDMPNLYIRGDGTRAYFFEKEELEDLLRGRFWIDQLGEDRRMIVNRKERVKMYRIWIQVKARKVGTLEGKRADTGKVKVNQQVDAT